VGSADIAISRNRSVTLEMILTGNFLGIPQFSSKPRY